MEPAEVPGKNRTAAGLVEVVEGIPTRRRAAVVVRVDIVEEDRALGQEVSLPEGMAAEEAGRIGQQEVCKPVEVRSESQPGASCPVLHCAFPVSVPDHDAATANA